MTVICLTGAPGAGKTTVGDAIASLAESGVHIQVDYFRKMVRAGYASPHHWNAEVERQYDLARRAAAATASTYASAGFTVVVDDIIAVDVVPRWRGLLLDEDLMLVLLDPPVEIALSRNASRPAWTVDPSLARELHRSLGRARTSTDWIVIDNSDLPAEEVARQVLGVAGRRG